MAVINSKVLNLAIKNNQGVETLMEKYSFGTIEELYESIKKALPTSAEYFIRELEKSKKQTDKRQKKSKSNSFRPKCTVEQCSKFTQEIEENVSLNEDSSITEVPTTKMENTELPDIVALKDEEMCLSEWLCQLEVSHKEIEAKRREIVSSLSNSKKVLETLRSSIEEQEKVVLQLCQEYNEQAQRMTSNSAEQAACREMLEELRMRITELEKIHILVFEDTSIVADGDELPNVSDEDIISNVNVLIKRTDAEDFTIKELKAIAKLKLIVEEYQKQNCIFEISFDSVKLQKFFENVA